MRLNFGCGDIIKEGWVNVDGRKLEGVDKVFDFNKIPYPFKKNMFTFVLLDNVLEHMDKPKEVLFELWRICKNNAIIKIRVPYYNSGGAYNSIEHMHYFNKRTFHEFVEYHASDKFRVVYVELESTKLGAFLPGFIREPLSQIWGNIVGVVNCELQVIKEVKK